MIFYLKYLYLECHCTGIPEILKQWQGTVTALYYGPLAPILRLYQYNKRNENIPIT